MLVFVRYLGEMTGILNEYEKWISILPLFPVLLDSRRKISSTGKWFSRFFATFFLSDLDWFNHPNSDHPTTVKSFQWIILFYPLVKKVFMIGRPINCNSCVWPCQISTVAEDSQDSQESVDSVTDSQKRREILSRRPSYRYRSSTGPLSQPQGGREKIPIWQHDCHVDSVLPNWDSLKKKCRLGAILDLIGLWMKSDDTSLTESPRHCWLRVRDIDWDCVCYPLQEDPERPVVWRVCGPADRGGEIGGRLDPRHHHRCHAHIMPHLSDGQRPVQYVTPTYSVLSFIAPGGVP